MKKKLFVTTIVIAMAISTLIGCGKSESNDSLQTNVEVLPAEGGSVNENPEFEAENMAVGKDTIEVTVEEYLNTVLKCHGTNIELLDTNATTRSEIEPSTEGLAMFIKNINDAQFTFSGAYVLYNGEPAEETLPAIYACGFSSAESEIDLSIYGIDSSVNKAELFGFGMDLTTNELGANNLYGMDDSMVPRRGAEEAFPEFVSQNIYFEYDASLDSSVMKNSDGKVLAYFGAYGTVDYENTRFMTFTTNMAEGEYVVYIPLERVDEAGEFYPMETMTEKQYVFVTHH